MVEQGQNTNDPRPRETGRALLLVTCPNAEQGWSTRSYSFPNVRALRSFEIAREVDANTPSVVIIEARFENFHSAASFMVKEDLDGIESYLRSKGLEESVVKEWNPARDWSQPSQHPHQWSCNVVWFKMWQGTAGKDYLYREKLTVEELGDQGLLALSQFRIMPYYTASSIRHLAVQRSLFLIFARNLSILVIPKDISDEPLRSRTRGSRSVPHGLSSFQTPFDELAANIKNDTTSSISSMLLRQLCLDIIRDEDKILRELQIQMNAMNRLMAHDKTLYYYVSHWRSVLAAWRAHIHSVHDLGSKCREIFQRLPSDGFRAAEEKESKTRDWDSLSISSLIRQADKLELDRQAALNHCESTFTALMATMSIVESGKAIAQAEQVTRLTQLAFFFIPLTFVAGIFGMNLKVSACPSRME